MLKIILNNSDLVLHYNYTFFLLLLAHVEFITVV